MFGPVNARQTVEWDGPNDYEETCYQQTGNDIDNAQVSYRILGRGYFSTSLFAGYKYTEIEGRGSHLK